MTRFRAASISMFGMIALVCVTLAGAAFAQDATLEGASVEAQNTFEQPGGSETPFGEPLTAEVSDDVEFDPIGPYQTDIDANRIVMTWDDGPQWDTFERVLEDDFFDRYYFEFSDVEIGGAEADDSASLVPNVTVDGNTVIVEFTTGMEVGDGFDAIIDITVGAASATSDDADDDTTSDTDDDDADDGTSDDDDDTDDDDAERSSETPAAPSAGSDDPPAAPSANDGDTASSTGTETAPDLARTGLTTMTILTLGLVVVGGGTVLWHFAESARRQY